MLDCYSGLCLFFVFFCAAKYSKYWGTKNFKELLVSRSGTEPERKNFFMYKKIHGKFYTVGVSANDVFRSLNKPRILPLNVFCCAKIFLWHIFFAKTILYQKTTPNGYIGHYRERLLGPFSTCFGLLEIFDGSRFHKLLSTHTLPECLLVNAVLTEKSHFEW